MSPALQAALYRWVAVILALLVAAAVYVLIPDPSIKMAAAGLLLATILALEELVKRTGPISGTPGADTSATLPPAAAQLVPFVQSVLTAIPPAPIQPAAVPTAGVPPPAASPSTSA